MSHCVNYTVRDIVDRWTGDMADIIILQDGTEKSPLVIRLAGLHITILHLVILGNFNMNINTGSSPVNTEQGHRAKDTFLKDMRTVGVTMSHTNRVFLDPSVGINSNIKEETTTSLPMNRTASQADVLLSKRLRRKSFIGTMQSLGSSFSPADLRKISSLFAALADASGSEGGGIGYSKSYEVDQDRK